MAADVLRRGWKASALALVVGSAFLKASSAFVTPVVAPQGVSQSSTRLASSSFDYMVDSPRVKPITVKNLPTDSDHVIRILDRPYKLAITGVVETIATIRGQRVALCRPRDTPVAIIDTTKFPMDVDTPEMALLIELANKELAKLPGKKKMEIKWTAHTLTVPALKRDLTRYLSSVTKSQPTEGEEEEEGNGVGRSTEEDVAEFFANIQEEDYLSDTPEGVEQRATLLEPEVLCSFQHRYGKYRVAVYREPLTMAAVWDPNDEVWDLAKGEWAEFYEDTIIYRQLKAIEVDTMV